MPYHVYILASESFALYVGVTRDLVRRIYDHRRSANLNAYSARHRIFKLVHIETTESIIAAITREKQLKGWRRSRKIALVESTNPGWRDLASDWFDETQGSTPSLRSG